jgi:hypothetical protein
MSRRLSIIGMALSLTYFFLLLFIFNGRLTEILLLKPNEIGDLLAGMFGPLAILWLILGFFQQGMELRQNTRALELQAEELRRSVDHQKEMVEVSREQLRVDMESLKQEQEAMRAAAKPRFVLMEARGSFLTRGVALHTNIKNVGNNATNVAMSSSEDLVDFQPIRVPAWAREEAIKVRWTHSPSSKKSFIRITFVDAIGMQGEQILRFDLDDREMLDGFSEEIEK